MKSVSMYPYRHSYEVTTDVYEGPLDLLLQLIEKAQLDITKLALAQVTDQYLEHLKNFSESQAEEVSSFLVIASKLIQIKSEALLPRPPGREEGEEDIGETLARQLQIYKRFKEIAFLLANREAEGLHTFIRIASPPKTQATYDFSEIHLDDLVIAAQEVFQIIEELQDIQSVVGARRVTIREKINLITRRLRELGKIQFSELLGQKPSRLDIVVTFLAILELIKQQYVLAKQEGLFSEIDIEYSGNWEDTQNIELEFED